MLIFFSLAIASIGCLSFFQLLDTNPRQVKGAGGKPCLSKISVIIKFWMLLCFCPIIYSEKRGCRTFKLVCNRTISEETKKSCMVTRYQHLFKTTLTSLQFIWKYDFGSKTLSRRKREKLSLLEQWPRISEIYRVKVHLWPSVRTVPG